MTSIYKAKNSLKRKNRTFSASSHLQGDPEDGLTPKTFGVFLLIFSLVNTSQLLISFEG